MYYSFHSGTSDGLMVEGANPRRVAYSLERENLDMLFMNHGSDHVKIFKSKIQEKYKLYSNCVYIDDYYLLGARPTTKNPFYIPIKPKNILA